LVYLLIIDFGSIVFANRITCLIRVFIRYSCATFVHLLSTHIFFNSLCTIHAQNIRFGSLAIDSEYPASRAISASTILPPSATFLSNMSIAFCCLAVGFLSGFFFLAVFHSTFVFFSGFFDSILLVGPISGFTGFLVRRTLSFSFVAGFFSGVFIRKKYQDYLVIFEDRRRSVISDDIYLFWYFCTISHVFGLGFGYHTGIIIQAKRCFFFIPVIHFMFSFFRMFVSLSA